MGVKNLPDIARRLIDAGRDPDEPAAAIERGTLPGQKAAVANSPDACRRGRAAGLRPPSILLFGAVAARREDIAWLERRPLFGKRVVVTGRAPRRAGWRARSRRSAPRWSSFPRSGSSRRSRRTRSAPRSSRFIPTPSSASPARTARAFCSRRWKPPGATRGRSARLRSPRSAPAPRERFGSTASSRTSSRSASSRRRSIEALAEVPVQGKPVLVARAAEARDVLPDALRERGAEVDVVALYETVRETPAPEEIEAAMDADYVTFTSSSTVRNFLEVTGGRVPEGARIVSIGPVTSETARESGIGVAIEASRHDPAGADRRVGGGCGRGGRFMRPPALKRGRCLRRPHRPSSPDGLDQRPRA